MDAANNKLRAIAPVIRDHGIEYERSHFKKKLEAGKITLARTEAWIKDTVSRVVAGSDPRVSLQGLVSGTHADYEAVLHIAMTDLVTTGPVSFLREGSSVISREGSSMEETVPETMLLDVVRIKALNARFLTDVVSAVIIITVDQWVKQHVRDVGARLQLVKSVSDAVVNVPPRTHINSKHAINAAMDVLVGRVSEQDLENVKVLVEKHVDPTHLVYMYMVSCDSCVWCLRACERSYLYPKLFRAFCFFTVMVTVTVMIMVTVTEQLSRARTTPCSLQ